MKMLILLLSMLIETPSADDPEVQLLDFTASYCAPCRQMVPILNRMESNGFPIRRIDITQEPDLSRQFQVEGVPTLVIMVKGKEVRRFVGLTAEAELREAMNKAARELSEQRGTAVLDAGPAPMSEQADQQPDRKTAARPKTGGGSSTLRDFFRGMFGDSGESSEQPLFRGQSPKSGRLTGLELAEAATVRIKVEGTAKRDGKEVTVSDIGTGTIIASEPGSAVILTCAHFFLGLKVSDTITTVEVFRDGVPEKFPATVIGGDHKLDLAILNIQSPEKLPVVSVTETAPILQQDQILNSFGCDGGKVPSKKTVMLIEENRYQGPGNLVCSTDPASGRSGGGLFDADGRLVGICSCANREKSEGLYMAWSAVDGLMEKLQLAQHQTPAADQSDVPSGDLENAGPDETPRLVDASPQTSAGTSDLTDEETLGFDPLAVNEDPATDLIVDAEPEKTRVLETVTGGKETAVGPEVTIIIDNKTSGSQKKVIVIPKASPWLMEMLTGETAEGRPVAAMKVQRPLSGKSREEIITPAAKAEYQEKP
jgi:thiol-disulfide isomerase/thioredoxin